MRLKRTLSILAALALVTAGAAQARPSRAAGVLPGGVHVVTATVSFPAVPRYARRRPITHTLTSRTKVAKLVSMVDALPTASQHVICPAIVVLGPELTLVFRAGPAGPALAESVVQVTTGSQGHSGSSPCFPIRLTVRGAPQAPRISGTFVRAVGRLIGADIS